MSLEAAKTREHPNVMSTTWDHPFTTLPNNESLYESPGTEQQFHDDASNGAGECIHLCTRHKRNKDGRCLSSSSLIAQVSYKATFFLS